MVISRYSYEELRAAAVAPGATQEDINALGEWFNCYGDCYWNGFYYDADGVAVVPIFDYDPETGDGTLTGYNLGLQ